MFLCLWHPKKSFWQHAGNCVNTSVFARPGPQNTVNTVIFASKTSVFTVFFGSENVKNTENTAYLMLFGICKNSRFDDFFGGLQKVPTTKITTTTTTGSSSNSYNNNNNNNDDDDDDDDDNNDNSKMQLAACHVRKFRWNPPLSFPPPTPTGIAGVRSSTISLWYFIVTYSNYVVYRRSL